MATLATFTPSFLNQKLLNRQSKTKPSVLRSHSNRNLKKFMVQAAAKLPSGVEMPRVQPKLTEPFLGFTTTAETWNSRASMIGIIGTFLVELIFHRGILDMIGVDVGKGLDLPL